jgi:hypothetical protein
MADHYRVLGVAPTAGHEDIKRAYTERALQVHPDRLVGASAEELERAHFKMQELNAAWEVLREPDRRAAYDAEAGVKSPVAAGVAGGPVWGPAVAVPTVRARGAVFRPQGVPELEPEFESVPTVVRKRDWKGHAPALVVVVLVVFVAAVACVAAVTSGPAPTNIETTERFPSGTCITVSREHVVSEASCRLAGAKVVVTREAFPRPCPTDTEAILLVEDDESLCVRNV